MREKIAREKGGGSIMREIERGRMIRRERREGEGGGCQPRRQSILDRTQFPLL